MAAPFSLLATCLGAALLLVVAVLADAAAVVPEAVAPEAVSEAAAPADGPPESRVRRTPHSDSLLLGSPSRNTNCKYAPVYGYLSADCSDRGLEGIPTLRGGVEALDMSENKMKVVANNTFAALAKLRILYLNENRIKVVENGALAGLYYLEVIDLSGNRLQNIPYGLLELPRLRKLYFADNLLGRLDPGFVFASPTLQLLQLAECNLLDLPLGELPELLHLNVSKNMLTSLPMHDLSAMCRLEILDLSQMATTLFEELDMEEACQCQTFLGWVSLRGLDLGRNTRIVCRNDTNHADEPYMPTCNKTQVSTAALEMHGRCVKEQHEHLRAQMRGWWVIVIGVVFGTIMTTAVVLCYCQRRHAGPRHHKVPVVVMTDPSQANGAANGHGQGRGRAGGGQTVTDGK